MSRRAVAESVVHALLTELRRKTSVEVGIVLHASLHGPCRGDRLDLEDALFTVAEQTLENES